MPALSVKTLMLHNPPAFGPGCMLLLCCKSIRNFRVTKPLLTKPSSSHLARPIDMASGIASRQIRERHPRTRWRWRQVRLIRHAAVPSSGPTFDTLDPPLIAIPQWVQSPSHVAEGTCSSLWPKGGQSLSNRGEAAVLYAELYRCRHSSLGTRETLSRATPRSLHRVLPITDYTQTSTERKSPV